MNTLKRIQPAQLLIVALVLVAVGALTFALRDTVREAVVIPLAYAVWLADLLLRMLPQSIFLALLVMLGLFIILRGFTQESASRDEPPARPEAVSFRSRLTFWLRLFDSLDRSPFAREQTAQELRMLALNALAQAEQLDPDEVVRRVRRGALDVPPEIESLLRDGQDWMRDERSPAQGSLRTLSALRRRLREAFGTLLPAQQTTAEAARLNRKIEAVIDYVEAQRGDSK